ncbi:MAG: septum formation initiator family protein [Candidatus Harrisonbacteria bacterium]|nr:septum formation initiator family protein [Candidatus Harrisonbacteria bacterium]
MRILLLALMLIIFGATIAQLRGLYQKNGELSAAHERIAKKVAALEKENVALEGRISYAGDEKNLEREARTELNYGAPGERMLIVVPKKNP